MQTNSVIAFRISIMSREPPAEPVTLFCARCAAELQIGGGHSYQVTIEVVADPAPPVITAEPPDELRGRIAELLDEMESLSEREALDQVYRRLILHLCGRCYVKWIENPRGLRLCNF
jgi:hypothetical protein